MPTAEETAAAIAAATQTSIQNAAAGEPAKPVEPAKAASDDAVDPGWLKTRLEREAAKGAAKALKEAGFDNADAAKAAGAALKAKAEADKSAELKAVEMKAALDTKTAEATRLTEMAARVATVALSDLTVEQHAAIKAVAGDDPAKQLETLEALKPTWAKPAAGADAKAKAPVVPGANTSGAGAAPPPANPNAPNHKATLESLEKTNPMAAAHYALRHQGEIYKGDGS